LNPRLPLQEAVFVDEEADSVRRFGGGAGVNFPAPVGSAALVVRIDREGAPDRFAVSALSGGAGVLGGGDGLSFNTCLPNPSVGELAGAAISERSLIVLIIEVLLVLLELAGVPGSVMSDALLRTRARPFGDPDSFGGPPTLDWFRLIPGNLSCIDDIKTPN
jgi:hypothetical protein